MDDIPPNKLIDTEGVELRFVREMVENYIWHRMRFCSSHYDLLLKTRHV